MIAYLCTWMFVFAVPWENVVMVPGLGTISRVLGLGAFGLTLVHVLAHAKVRKLSGFHWIALAYLGWVLLSGFWAVNSFCQEGKGCDVWLIVRIYIQLFAMLWVVWEVTTTRPRLLKLLQAYVLGAFVAAGGTIWNYAHEIIPGHSIGRFAASGFDANDLGMMLALALPMAWYLSSGAAGPLQRWLNRGYFVIGGVAILLTGSRGAMLASMVALFVIPWTLTQVRSGVRIAAVVMMLGVGVAAIRFVPKGSFERLSTTTTEISQGTLNERLEIWKAGIAAVPARPLLGYGPAGWRAVLTREQGYKGAHNTYLSILVEEGLIGLMLYLGIFVALLRRLPSLPSFERKVALVLLATLATAMIPLDWDTRKPGWVILALLVSWSDLLRVARGPSRVATAVAARRPADPRRPAAPVALP